MEGEIIIVYRRIENDNDVKQEHHVDRVIDNHPLGGQFVKECDLEGSDHAGPQEDTRDEEVPRSETLVLR